MAIRPFITRPTSIEYGLVVAALVLSAATSFAGPAPQGWEYIPQVDSISFSATSVGLTTAKAHYLVDRSTGRMQEVSKGQFEQSFDESARFKAAEFAESTAIGAGVRLNTSSDRELITDDAYCAEAHTHSLWMNGDPLKSHVPDCSSVSCAEIVGGNLWLGTRYDREWGEYPAIGVVIQALDDGRLLETLDRKGGLTGDLIRVIRLDPFDKAVWVATNRGLNVVDRSFRILESLFFYEELDSESGRPVWTLGPTTKPLSRLTRLFKTMKVSDAKQFHDTFLEIPETVRERFTNGMLDGQYHRQDGQSAKEAFAPTEVNILAPFYIEDVASGDETVRTRALRHICVFNDQRVIDFLVERIRLLATLRHPRDTARVRGCLAKFTKFGLVNGSWRDDQTTSMVQIVRDALERTRTPDVGGAPTGTRPDTHGDNRLIADLAKRLKLAGDRRGIDLINEYFEALDGNRFGRSNEEISEIFRDAALYDWIGLNLGSEIELTPAMLSGLKKLSVPSVWRTGCRLFDMRRPRTPPRFDATYAKAMLVAIERRGARGAPRPGNLEGDVCVESYKSQLADRDVRETFMRDMYPKLTPIQKALSDKLGKARPTSDAGSPKIEPHGQHDLCEELRCADGTPGWWTGEGHANGRRLGLGFFTCPEHERSGGQWSCQPIAGGKAACSSRGGTLRSRLSDDSIEMVSESIHGEEFSHCEFNATLESPRKMSGELSCAGDTTVEAKFWAIRCF